MSGRIIDAAIARRVKGGANEDESVALLNELVATHSGGALEHALYYYGFATERGAALLAAALDVNKKGTEQ